MLLWGRTLTNSKFSEGCKRISFQAIGLCHWSIFSGVHVIAGFRNNFQDLGWLLEQFKGHKRLSESRNKLSKEGYWKNCYNLVIWKWFYRSKQKLYFLVSTQNCSNKLWKPSALIKKFLTGILEPLKIFTSWPYPLSPKEYH